LILFAKPPDAKLRLDGECIVAVGETLRLVNTVLSGRWAMSLAVAMAVSFIMCYCRLIIGESVCSEKSW
jgi:hypothetical protein